MTRRVLLATAGIALASGVVLMAQGQTSPAPAFEVASVKPNKSGEGFIRFGMQPGGRFTASNVPLRELIRFAYALQDFQILDAPGWIASDRFDVIAKAEGNIPPSQPGTVGPLQRMVQSLLAERFQLKARLDMREMPRYDMVLARSDGKLGPQLKPSTTDCQALFAAARRGGAPPAPPGPGERLQCGFRIGPGLMQMGASPLSQLANALSPMVQRVVIDRTGLPGNFDLEMTFILDQLPKGPPTAGAPPLPPIDPDGASIFTALQEQLGLKLEPTRGPVDVLVIDSVEHPTEN
jgi:bla regulator protein blaR1